MKLVGICGGMAATLETLVGRRYTTNVLDLPPPEHVRTRNAPLIMPPFLLSR
jgi:hypothetical protein